MRIGISVVLLVDEAELLHAREDIVGKILPLIRVVIQVVVFDKRVVIHVDTEET